MFVKSYPAMKIKNWLLIADIHIGITTEMWERGISLPSQVESLIKKANRLAKLTKTKNLVIMGDLKHKVTKISMQEAREVPHFLTSLNFKKIVVLKGNHDGFIEKLVPKGMVVKKSFVIGDYILTHGHRNIESSKKKIIIGHNQPHVRFRDAVGAMYSVPVWVKGPLKNGKELTIVPAFNDLCGATVVNSDELLGPIAKNLLLGEAHAYLLDGTDLGTLDSLMLKK